VPGRPPVARRRAGPPVEPIGVVERVNPAWPWGSQPERDDRYSWVTMSAEQVVAPQSSTPRNIILRALVGSLLLTVHAMPSHRRRRWLRRHRDVARTSATTATRVPDERSGAGEPGAHGAPDGTDMAHISQPASEPSQVDGRLDGTVVTVAVTTTTCSTAGGVRRHPVGHQPIDHHARRRAHRRPVPGPAVDARVRHGAMRGPSHVGHRVGPGPGRFVRPRQSSSHPAGDAGTRSLRSLCCGRTGRSPGRRTA